MDAAEPARAHEPDPRDAARGERPADGRRPDGALHRADGQVARAELARRRVEAAQLVRRQADPDASVEDAHGCRHRARLTHAPLRLERDRDALLAGEPVRDERRLERDDRRAVAQRVGDLGRDPHQLVHGIAPSFATQRAAASSPSSGPPSR